MTRKIYGIAMFLTLALFSACIEKDSVAEQKSAFIMLGGQTEDVAYAHTSYKDPGAEVMEYVDGEKRCSGIFADATGSVNMEVPGTYVLTYVAMDSHRKLLPAVTRTVHVLQNDAAFLNGVYNVACTCSAVIGSSNPTITSESYIATVAPGSENNRFELSRLNVGPVFVTPVTSLNNNEIQTSYYHRDLHTTEGSRSGTLSASKESFTIETTSLQLYPSESYGKVFTCKNIFTNSKPGVTVNK